MDLKKLVGRLAEKNGAKEGLTSREVGAEIGRSDKASREFIRKALAAGFAKSVGLAPRQNIAGVVIQVPVYKFCKEGRRCKSS